MKMAIPPVIVLILLLVTWELATHVLAIKPIVLPPPSDVLVQFIEQPSTLIFETGITMAHAMLGFIVGSLIAFVFAALFIVSNVTRQALYPFAIAIKTTPLIATAPLIVLWFGDGSLSKVAMAAVVCFFPVLVNTVSGLASVDRESIDLLRSLSASRLQILIRLEIPTATPYIFSSLRVASSLAVVGAVIAEFLGSTHGIGSFINRRSYYSETDEVFAGIVALCCGGILFFVSVGLIERLVVFWQPRG